ncbi:trafficking regulator of GLUT4 1-like [Xenia sp. Carnegie-2017]|uniref:trafficking regulator of GLUT4 1-like n=1 Tax=Xenia sp. Carnegie-2017 TaxID=2897299 RepID=UPI001F0333EF|nr:trafficking regulator of GLUT4 1-like [Xenia sp. Carnegie-2017]
MCLSIFACLCCFWPVGLCAIAKSKEVKTYMIALWVKMARTLADRGDYERARVAAKTAKLTAWVAMLFGVIFAIILIVMRL